MSIKVAVISALTAAGSEGIAAYFRNRVTEPFDLELGCGNLSLNRETFLRQKILAAVDTDGYNFEYVVVGLVLLVGFLTRGCLRFTFAAYPLPRFNPRHVRRSRDGYVEHW